MKWTIHEDTVLVEGKKNKRSYAQIQEDFRNDPKCNNRNMESIRNRWRYLNKNPHRDEDDFKRIFEILKRRQFISINELADLTKTTKGKLAIFLHKMMEQGKDISISNNAVLLNSCEEFPVLSLESDDDGFIEYAQIADTHLCSKYQQLTALHMFYDEVAKRGIRYVFHAGDAVDGFKVYPLHTSEVFLQTQDDQEDYFVEKYPKRPDVHTIMILGNHPESYLKLSGTDFLKKATRRREDIVYIGRHSGVIERNGFKFYLHHGDGHAYAESYKLQKLAETFTGADTPDVIIQGHYHTEISIMIRGIYCAHPASFQGRTPYAARKAFPEPVIGGHIVRLERKGDLLIRTVELIEYNEIQHDYRKEW